MSYYFIVKLLAKISLRRGREYQLSDRLGDYLRKGALNDSYSVLNGRLEKERTRTVVSRSALLSSRYKYQRTSSVCFVLVLLLIILQKGFRGNVSLYALSMFYVPHHIPCSSSVTFSHKETYQEQLILTKIIRYACSCNKDNHIDSRKPRGKLSDKCNRLLYCVVSHEMNGTAKNSHFRCAIYSFIGCMFIL